jgi:hypothetical protein
MSVENKANHPLENILRSSSVTADGIRSVTSDGILIGDTDAGIDCDFHLPSLCRSTYCSTALRSTKDTDRSSACANFSSFASSATGMRNVIVLSINAFKYSVVRRVDIESQPAWITASVFAVDA